MKRLSGCVNSLLLGAHNFVVENIVNIALKSIVMLQELCICVVWQGGSSGKRVICYHISLECWNKYNMPVLILLTGGKK